MAIIKRKTNYQVKIRGSDGKWLSKTFATKREAEAFEGQMMQHKRNGEQVSNMTNQITVDEYFLHWFEMVKSQASAGWRKEQHRLYQKYVSSLIGPKRLRSISPQLISGVLNEMAKLGKAEQTRLHVFALLRKMFGDAIELFQLVTFNPVLRKLKPRVPLKEARYLNVDQAKTLLSYVQGRDYCVAIWLQLYLGLRVGEVQALRWSSLDLDEGVLSIRSAYCRKERVMRDYPKGRKQHSHRIPPELLRVLTEAKGGSTSDFVVTSPAGEMLSYEWYVRTLRRYCKVLSLQGIGTHGLRHSTSEIYLGHGATRDDLRKLFDHSSAIVTDRYVHDKGTNLERVAKVIQLFPGHSQLECSQNVPKSTFAETSKS